MKLNLGQAQITVTQASDAEYEWLREYLTFEDAKARYIQRVHGYGDGTVKMFNRLSSSFPIGFSRIVAKEAKKQGFTVEVTNSRQTYSTIREDVDLSWLRDYQLEAVNKAISKQYGILQLPTGSGKGWIAVAFPVKIDGRWLFTVHRKQLMYDVAKRYEQRTGSICGIIGDGKLSIEEFTVATFKTLADGIKRKDLRITNYLDTVEGLIVDECHTAAADTFYRTVMYIQAYYRIGLSATPLDRTDKRSVMAVGGLGPVIHSIHPDKLIELGILTRPVIKMVSFNNDATASTYQGVYGQNIVRNEQRNKLLTEIAVAAAKPSLLFVKELKHGKRLLSRLLSKGVRAEFVWGQTKQRDAAIQRLERGELDLLVCSVVFQEGVDIPDLRSVIRGAAGASPIAALQNVGRGMRTSEDKGPVFEVWDIFDKGNKILQRHSNERRKAYQSQNYEVTILASL